MAARARTDPEFALRIAEAGFGRPPQALDVAFSGPRTVEVVFGAGVSGVGLGDE